MVVLAEVELGAPLLPSYNESLPSGSKVHIDQTLGMWLGWKLTCFSQLLQGGRQSYLGLRPKRWVESGSMCSLGDLRRMTLHKCLVWDDSVFIKSVLCTSLQICMPSYKLPLYFWLSQGAPKERGPSLRTAVSWTHGTFLWCMCIELVNFWPSCRDPVITKQLSIFTSIQEKCRRSIKAARIGSFGNCECFSSEIRFWGLELIPLLCARCSSLWFTGQDLCLSGHISSFCWCSCYFLSYLRHSLFYTAFLPDFCFLSTFIPSSVLSSYIT